MNIDIEPSVYQAFYEVLNDTIIETEFGGKLPNEVRTRKSNLIWDHLPEGVFKEKFAGDKKISNHYFYRKKSELNPKKIIVGEIDAEVFNRALKYLKIPMATVDYSLPYPLSVEFEARLRYQQFKLDHFPPPPVENVLINEVVIENKYSMSQHEIASILSYTFREYILSKKFWGYCHAFNTRLKNSPDDHWQLDKLLIEFYDMSGINFNVKISALDSVGMSFEGKTDFYSSTKESVVIECKSVTRNPGHKLVMIIAIYPNKKLYYPNLGYNLIFGKYITQKVDSRITIGSIILEKISDNSSNLQPNSYLIPKPIFGRKQYKSDFENINKNIINYLYRFDASEFFRTNPFQGIPTIKDLEDYFASFSL